MSEPLENTPPENPSDAFVGERLNPFGEPLPERQGTRAGFPLRHEDQPYLAAWIVATAKARQFCDGFEALGASLFEKRQKSSFLLALPPFDASSRPDIKRARSGSGVTRRSHAISKRKDKASDHVMRRWCLEADSNHRHADFQSAALPTELSRRRRGVARGGSIGDPFRTVQRPFSPFRHHFRRPRRGLREWRRRR